MIRQSTYFPYSHAAARALQSNVGGTPGGVPPLIIFPVGCTSCDCTAVNCTANRASMAVPAIGKSWSTIIARNLVTASQLRGGDRGARGGDPRGVARRIT